MADGENREESLSYGELDRRARQVAAGLKKHLQTGDRVLLVFPPGLDFIVGFYGCLYAGAVAVPIFPPQPGKLKQTLAPFESSARDAQAKCILCNSFVYSKRLLLTWIAKGLKGLPWLNVADFLASTSPAQASGPEP
ncbi:MAG TPA: AMP-binding protein, partial [bacterium]|nr:AMP-binding protein [bacterium]